MPVGHDEEQHQRIQRPHQMCAYPPHAIRAHEPVKDENKYQVRDGVPRLQPEKSTRGRIPADSRRGFLGQSRDWPVPGGRERHILSHRCRVWVPDRQEVV